MELINILIILISISVTYVWSIKKRFEIQTMRISFIDEEKEEDFDDYERKVIERQKLIFEDSQVSSLTIGNFYRTWSTWRVRYKKLHNS